MNKLIVILGPTASGKTDLAVFLAKKLKSEVVSADSRQIYKEMDIGTAKVTKKEMTGVPHYLIDIIPPNKTFTLAQYKIRTIKIIKDIQRRGKTPFLVGGTGLYIKAVVENLQIPKVAPNPALREKLEKKTNEELLKDLAKLDPQAAETIDRKNKRRLVRALEVCILSGKPFSALKIKGKPMFEVLQLGISVPRKTLYRRINQRVERQIKDGLIDEVKNLSRKYGWNLPSLSGIGYKEFKPYFEEKITLREAKKNLKQNTRQYARRQMTWFRKDKSIQWIKNAKEANRLIKKFLQQN